MDGERRFDIDDVPPTWGQPADRSAALLEAHTAEEVLRLVGDFVAYGSEVGKSCDNPFCCG